ncbi:MAG: (2Fe-2S)-binding protein [Spirochaetaceae bacterium]|nr:MAG: (2Fe-2S)-binding protein [Spirochaetaceae bacterium]
MTVEFMLDEEPVSIDVHPMETLLEILRTHLGRTATRQGCGRGECGSCQVFMDDMLVNACLVPAFRLEGKIIQTIEGFSRTKDYLDIEKAFLAKNITQCGFCVPSLVLSAQAILQAKSAPMKHEVEDFLAGNFCLYSGLHQVADAIIYAAQLRRKRRDGKKGRTD